ncbi:CHAT domain-containing protein [Mycena rebaudengoi]|nr:CHAT domain-containing protein [Mycena rebaudengoi]
MEHPAFSIAAPNSEDETTDLFNTAHDFLAECKQTANISTLNTAVYLLNYAASGFPHGSPEQQDCCNHLATALFTRFIYTGDENDVHRAALLRNGAPVLESMDWNNEDSEEIQNTINLAVALVAEVHQAPYHDTLANAITLYEEALKLLPTSDFRYHRILWEISEGLLILFHTTGNMTQLDQAQHYLAQLRQLTLKPSLLLFAGLMLRDERPADPLGEASYLEGLKMGQQICQNDLQALQLGTDGRKAYKLFEEKSDPTDLNSAIRMFEQAESLLSWGHTKRAMILYHLGSSTYARAQRLNTNAEDLERAIKKLRESVALDNAIDSSLGASLNCLGDSLLTRSGHGGGLKDLDEAISLYQQSVDLHFFPEKLHEISLHHLANAVYGRFQQTRELVDLDESIQLFRIFVTIYTIPSSARSAALHKLANAIHIRFLLLGEQQNSQEVVELHSEAMKTYCARHPDDPLSCLIFAVALRTCVMQKDIHGDFNESVGLLREALDFRLEPGFDPAVIRILLGQILHGRFEQKHDPKDIGQAIDLYREALQFEAAPLRGLWLLHLAQAMHQRYEDQTDVDDIDEVIEYIKEALEILDSSDPKRDNGERLLADAFTAKFRRHGNPRDIDEAIRRMREILTTKREASFFSLDGLACALHLRFESRGDSKDLDEAIELATAAVATCQESFYQPTLMSHLAGLKIRRYEDKDNGNDLNEEIKLERKALELIPPSHPQRASSLTHLATALDIRLNHSEDSADRDEAIALFREALNITPVTEPLHCVYLNNLATILQRRFRRAQNPQDISESVNLMKKLVDICPEHHPSRGMYLTSFANAANQLERSGLKPQQTKIVDDITSALREASTYVQGSLLSRLRASNTWTRIAAEHRHSSWLDAVHTRINLLPQLAAFHWDLTTRQQILSKSEVTDSSSSALDAINQGQHDAAVEFLEASRSIFWTQALNLRMPLDRISDAGRPDLAAKLEKLSQQLEQASFRDTSRTASTAAQERYLAMDAEAIRTRELNEEWEETISSVRMLAGLEDFLLPKRIPALRHAAASGVVVILLASNSASSALIVHASVGVEHVALPWINSRHLKFFAGLTRALSSDNFDLTDFLEGRNQRKGDSDESEIRGRLFGWQEGRLKINPEDVFRRYLGDLWTAIVQPVFKVLHLTKSDSPPRLWWCPTGPFAFVPIHAAGIYTELQTDCVSDYVVSSYTPTLTALLNPPAHAETVKATVVVEPHAPNCSPLPGTEEESGNIERRIPSQTLTVLRSPTRDEVTPHLQDSSIVHFACHGIQDLKNPLDSGLMVADGCLKVSHIMRRPDNGEREKTENVMKLAFLSACETAKGDEKTPDESMHLAATLLFAGFRGVVATMWSMNDEDGPQIADTFYEHLFRGCDLGANPPALPDLTKAAEALHFAVKKLRKESGMSFKRWVPFVHYGL